MNKIRYSDSPRKPCPNCSRKHLGKAVAQLQESLQGYPDNFWLAVGNISEAEDEIIGLFPDIADNLREARKQMEVNDSLIPDLLPVISDISGRISCGDGELCSVCAVEIRNSTHSRRGSLTSLAKHLRR